MSSKYRVAINEQKFGAKNQKNSSYAGNSYSLWGKMNRGNLAATLEPLAEDQQRNLINISPDMQVEY